MLEKLISILSDFFEVGGNCYHYILERVKHADLTPDDFREYDEDDVAEIAEHLIDNGVTVQRWIPVTERLPNRDDANKGMYVLAFATEGWARTVEWDTVVRHPDWFTHWMHLPEPPKEVAE